MAVKYTYKNSGTDFCPLIPEIARFSIGFRLDTLPLVPRETVCILFPRISLDIFRAEVSLLNKHVTKYSSALILEI